MSKYVFILIQLMKQICIVICFFMLTAFGANAQSNGSLEVTKYNGHNSKTIKEGSRIHVITNGKKYKGHLKVLSDQSFLVNADTILISQVQELNSQTVETQINGISLIIPGAIVGGFGATATVAGLIEGGYGFLGVIFGVPLAGIGIFAIVKGTHLLTKGKKFSSSKWKYTLNAPTN